MVNILPSAVCMPSTKYTLVRMHMCEHVHAVCFLFCISSRGNAKWDETIKTAIAMSHVQERGARNKPCDSIEKARPFKTKYCMI